MMSTITRRLTVAFSSVMMAVLVSGGMGVYFGERFSLDRNLRRELDRQGDEIQRLVNAPSVLTNRGLRDRRDSYVQILDSTGREIAATRQLAGKELLSDSQITRAMHGVQSFQRGSITDRKHHSFRIRTEAVTDGSQRRIIVVAIRRDARDEALRELLGQLLGFGALALFATVLVGYRLTRAALRPVEHVRRQADALYRGLATGTLDVPTSYDEISALATTLNELLARVQTTVTRERQFSAAVSHELRTPLTALKAELDLASRAPRSHKQLLTAIGAASTDTERLIRLAEDLLLLRTPETGVPQSLHQIGRVVMMAVNHRAVDVQMDTTAANKQFSGSDTLVVRAIQNLIDNGERHGGSSVHLRVSSDEDSVQIHVTDDGPGFNDIRLDAPFEPFGRGSGKASGTGTGLGLSIVEAIMRAHGGNVSAKNGPPTSVRLTIPSAT